jgi:tetratricopeptide (TPR) repeat protein
MTVSSYAQAEIKSSDKVKKASQKIESGYKKNNQDTLAQGYFDLGESFYQKGDLSKSETYYEKAKSLFEKMQDADGIAKSSRALAKVQEDLHKEKEAIGNYNTARDNNVKTGDITGNTLNGNDIRRLTIPDSAEVQQSLIQQNIKLGLINKDTGEIVSNFSRMGDMGLKNNNNPIALDAYSNAFQFSKKNPEQALLFNQRITDVYLQEKNFPKAIETKQQLLNEDFVQNSTQIKAREITSLAGIYLLKNEDSTAIRLLNESYALSLKNGHTLEAKACVQKLDSIYQRNDHKELSLNLYKDFLAQLPVIITKDSSIADNRLIAETEAKIKELETEKTLKDDIIRRKNIFNYWLIGSVVALVLFTVAILYIIRRLRIQNKKIALQSLRREMNPHFIFNSLNSINQFMAGNNELEANQYLTKFSTLMRGVMENSKEDFVLFSKEIELLQHYLELEKSRFPDKFDFNINMDDALLADEHLYIPGMLIQPYLENAIWHGLRYMEEKGFLQLNFTRMANGLEIIIDDNGIGMAESIKNKTENQKKRSGRGISNTLERIKILNELYHQHITCSVEDKAGADKGVRVIMMVPLLKNFKA